MSIKTDQAILKCFINLKSSVWFTLGSEDETVFYLASESNKSMICLTATLTEHYFLMAFS